MIRYAIATGTLRNAAGNVIGVGYSGHGQGRDNPQAVAVADVGPLPPGRYKIGKPFNHPRLGPFVMVLNPEPETVTFGRTAFRVHGDNAAHDASHGCIVASRFIREQIDLDQDRVLDVVVNDADNAPVVTV